MCLAAISSTSASTKKELRGKRSQAPPPIGPRSNTQFAGDTASPVTLLAWMLDASRGLHVDARSVSRPWPRMRTGEEREFGEGHHLEPLLVDSRSPCPDFLATGLGQSR